MESTTPTTTTPATSTAESEASSGKEDCERRLLEATWKGDEEEVKELLWFTDIDVDARSEGGWTALFWAAFRGFAPIVQLLLDANANVHTKDQEGATALHHACERGKHDAVRVLLAANANVHGTDRYGNPPLIRALRNSGSTEIPMEDVYRTVFELATHGAEWGEKCNLLVPKEDPKAGLRLCVIQWGLERARHLPFSHIPLPVVCRGDDAVLAYLTGIGADTELLVATAASPSARPPLPPPAPQRPAAFPVNVTEPIFNPHVGSQEGNSSLHDACSEPSLELASVLLTTGADVNATNMDGWKPLHFVIGKRSYSNWHNAMPYEFLGIVYLLACHGAEWDITCSKLVSTSQTINSIVPLRMCLDWWAEERKQGRALVEVPLEVVESGVLATQSFIDDAMNQWVFNNGTDGHGHGHQQPAVSLLLRKVVLLGNNQAGITTLAQSLATEMVVMQDGEKCNSAVGEQRTINVTCSNMTFAGYGNGSVQHIATLYDLAGRDKAAIASALSLFFTRRSLFLVAVDLEDAARVGQTDSQDKHKYASFVKRAVVPWIQLLVSHQSNAEIVLVGTKADVVKPNDPLCVIELIQKEVTHQLEELGMKPLGWISVSCEDQVSVFQARAQVETLVIKFNRSVALDQDQAKVLDKIETMRREAAPLTGKRRVAAMVKTMEQLRIELGNDDDDDCRETIEKLHPAGKLLWFELPGVELLSTTIFLDPQILIDLIRVVLDAHHTNNRETIAHATLITLPLWANLDENLMLGLKQLLRHVGVVHSTDGDMAWDSDLIVPAYAALRARAPPHSVAIDEQQQKQKPFRLAGDQAQVDYAVKWQYHVTGDQPATLMENLLLATFSPLWAREINHDGFRYQPNDSFACQVVVEQDLNHQESPQFVVRLEALAAAEGDKQNHGMWWIFQHVAQAIDEVLAGYPQLMVTRSTMNQNNEPMRLETAVASWTRAPKAFRATLKWLPPDLTWYQDILDTKQ